MLQREEILQIIHQNTAKTSGKRPQSVVESGCRKYQKLQTGNLMPPPSRGSKSKKKKNKSAERKVTKAQPNLENLNKNIENI